ncbi:MAG: DUF6141 family protein [Granulosicoccaceae bacterium]|jgi:hypothetical protein
MTAVFHEEQRFTQRWLWILLMLSMLVVLAVFGYGLIEQLVYGRPWGDRPVSDTTLILVSAAVILFTAGMIYLFYTLRLVTEVRAEGLYIRFYPLHGKLIPYTTIKSCEARTYKPLSEYGGWGIKYGRSGWAYNIIGDRGVQLELHNGKRILIGSQRADELAMVIKEYRRC